jgi:hypothetical protein
VSVDFRADLKLEYAKSGFAAEETVKHALVFLLSFWAFALLPAPTVRAQSEAHSPVTASAESFCEQFQVIANASSASFKPLRGKVEGIDIWKGQQPLPGTANCIVYGRRGDASYICSSAMVRGNDQVQQLFNTLKSQVQKCLGDGWAANDYTARHGDPSVAFSKAEADYDVRVAVKSLEGRPEKEITLTVARP